MKILLVTYFFAPSNGMGALRAARMAVFLTRSGHDVRVLTAPNPGFPQTLACELPAGRVLRTEQIDINWVPKRLAALRKDGAPGPGRAATGAPSAVSNPASPRPPSLTAGLLRRSAALYIDALNWPDARAGWLPYALRAGRRLFRTWRPDLVFASCPPATGLLIGKLLAARARVRWVAEFRDRWSDDPYRMSYDPYRTKSALRRALEPKLERWILSSANGIVTVSEPWAERYANTHGKPTAVVLNGFDPEDYAGRDSCGAPDSGSLEIVYTGGIYPNRRDPSPLFRAVALLTKYPVRVQFYGTSPAHVLPLACAQGVPDRIVVHPHLPHKQVQAVQQRADVLLLMQWNDPREQGNVPGKLFEYLGARRPILGLGLEDGVPAKIIRERKAGYVINDPARIAAQLSAWLETKRQLGHLPPLPPAACAGFTCAEQFARLEQFLRLLACDD